MTKSIKKISDLLNKLPGIGQRQANRLALSFLEWHDIDLQDLSMAISKIKSEYHLCIDCFNIAEDQRCKICTSSNRDRTRIAVVERTTDLQSIEKTGQYIGLYHVLGGVINPAQNMIPEKLRVRELISRLSSMQSGHGQELELILATNPNTHGETTALYLEHELAVLNIKITRLARGLSSGTSLEYADPITLANAFKNRK